MLNHGFHDKEYYADFFLNDTFFFIKIFNFYFFSNKNKNEKMITKDSVEL